MSDAGAAEHKRASEEKSRSAMASATGESARVPLAVSIS